MRLSCKDVNPTTTCTFEAVGETAADVAKNLLVHARVKHAEDVKSMSDEEIMKWFEGKAHQ